MRTIWHGAAFLALGATLAGCATTGNLLWWTKKTDASGVGGVAVGQPAPEIDGEDLHGRRFQLSEHRGQVVLLDYWATWCGYCVRMFPQERALVERMRGRPFVMLGIDVQDDRDAALALVHDGQVTWRNWFDPAGCISQAYGVGVYPTIFLIDHRGIVQAVYRGAPGPEMEEKLEALVREAEGARKMMRE